MPSAQSTIFLSVVSGIITSCIVFLMISLFKNLVIPWYQKLTYQGIDVCGAWYASFGTSRQIVSLELIQSANHLHGIATFSTDQLPHNHYEPVRIFQVNGIVQDRFLSLSGMHRDRQRLGINSYLLEVIGDGRKLQGVITFYSVTNSKITSDSILFTRDIPRSKPNLDMLSEPKKALPKH